MVKAGVRKRDGISPSLGRQHARSRDIENVKPCGADDRDLGRRDHGEEDSERYHTVTGGATKSLAPRTRRRWRHGR